MASLTLKVINLAYFMKETESHTAVGLFPVKSNEEFSWGIHLLFVPSQELFIMGVFFSFVEILASTLHLACISWLA